MLCWLGLMLGDIIINNNFLPECVIQINFGIRPPNGKMLTITVIKKQSKAKQTKHFLALTCMPSSLVCFLTASLMQCNNNYCWICMLITWT